MSLKTFKPGQILKGSLFNEPMRVETVRQTGPDTWAVGLVGTQSEKFRKRPGGDVVQTIHKKIYCEFESRWGRG